MASREDYRICWVRPDGASRAAELTLSTETGARWVRQWGGVVVPAPLVVAGFSDKTPLKLEHITWLSTGAQAVLLVPLIVDERLAGLIGLAREQAGQRFLPGEVEIAGWEIASGCGRHPWAWLLNLGAFAVGMALFPKRLYRAFVRGRHAANLYREGFPETELRTKTVGWLRHRLQIDRDDIGNMVALRRIPLSTGEEKRVGVHNRRVGGARRGCRVNPVIDLKELPHVAAAIGPA